MMLGRREFLKASGALALSAELPKGKRLALDREFGARGDGVTDDSDALAHALKSGAPLTGNGKTYAVSGNFRLPDNADIENVILKQLSPGNASRRTLIKNSGRGPIRLSRVKVDRGGDTTQGSVNDAAGIWIANVSDVSLEDVEITGNSIGTGLMILNCNRIKVVRPNIHDMRWSAPADPGTEQVVGLWMNGCTDWVIEEPNVRNLDGIMGGQAPRPYQTDGIDVSGSSSWRIIGGTVSRCGEGIDVSGSQGNSGFTISGTEAIDCDSFGIKFANSASRGVITGTVARGCGLGGHVVGGAAQPNLPKCENLTFTRCKSISTGATGTWARYNTAGFAVLTGKFDTAWPQGISFVECEAIDEQRPPTMKYGYRSEPAITSATIHPNRLIGCVSRGHSVARTLGEWR